jgi:hypothetical protein
MAFIVHSDLDSKLSLDSAGNPKIVTNHESIRQSIRTILSTSPGERIMLPEFGSRIRSLLFEPMDDHTVFLMENEIRDAIQTWEDRVNVSYVSVNADFDDLFYEISIEYSIIETGQRGEFYGVVGVEY